MKMIRCTYVNVLYVVLLLFGCSQKNEKLETALELAGENRVEFEKVLQHYSKSPADSLRLKAAEFLIGNMPGHYTLEGELVNEFRDKIKNDTTGSYYAKKELNILLGHFPAIREGSRKREDIQHIKAGFLIRHIDASFEILDKYPWLSGIPDDIFFEFLLPYRFQDEHPDLWRDSLHVSPESLKKASFDDAEKHSLLKRSNEMLEESQAKITTPITLSLSIGSSKPDCYEEHMKKIYRYRVRGIPATLDFIPHYANRNGYHCWAIVISPEIKTNELYHLTTGKFGKVYRYTFSKRDNITPRPGEYMPELFRTPFFKDVSTTYLETSDVLIRFRNKRHGKPCYGYLSVFNNSNWQPIAIGKMEKNKVEFKDMGRNIVYLPVYYGESNVYALDFPFILNGKGERERLIPDTCSRQKMRILRKYPFNTSLYNYLENIDGKIILASNTPSFSKADTLIRFQSRNMVYYDQLANTDKSYRYYRYASDSTVSFIAELAFIDRQGNVLKGEVEGAYSKGFDGDPLTDMFINKKSITVDFGRPVNVARVVCIPRGDGNGVYPGDVYELLYHDLGGWRSLGVKMATDYHIEYDNVPGGALYWLRNLTAGIEERPFTCTDGNIRFW